MARSWNDPDGDFDFITSVWADAADIEPVALATVLESANALCRDYAPALAEGAPVPAAYRLAELFQARHIWSSFQGSNRQEFGADGMEISTSTWSLVLQARDLLRPRTSPLRKIR